MEEPPDPHAPRLSISIFSTDLSRWDYGQLRLYATNCIRLASDAAGDGEAAMMREFFGVKSTVTRSAVGDDVAIEGGSVVSDSALGAGSVRGSALANVACDEIDAEGAILVNVTAPKIFAARGAVVYNGAACVAVVVVVRAVLLLPRGVRFESTVEHQRSRGGTGRARRPSPSRFGRMSGYWSGPLRHHTRDPPTTTTTAARVVSSERVEV